MRYIKEIEETKRGLKKRLEPRTALLQLGWLVPESTNKKETASEIEKIVKEAAYDDLTQKEKAYTLLPLYNSTATKKAKLTESDFDRWERVALAEWLYGHFHVCPLTLKTLTSSTVQENNHTALGRLRPKHVICTMSGGKDSVASTVLACEQWATNPTVQVHILHCDTKNEAPMTVDYLKELDFALTSKYGIEITHITPKLGFYELVKKKGLFPDRLKRFCTDQLKAQPLDKYTLDLQGGDVLVYRGTRRSESASRQHRIQYYFDNKTFSYVYLPLCYYANVYDVFEVGDTLMSFQKTLDVYEANRPKNEETYKEGLKRIKAFGYSTHPHYGLGYGRIGCGHCIMSTKSDIRASSIYYGESVIEKIRAAEKATGSSFFWRGHTPQRFRDKTWAPKCKCKAEQCTCRTIKIASIDSVVKWARTPYRSRKSAEDPDLFSIIPKRLHPTHPDFVDKDTKSRTEEGNKVDANTNCSIFSYCE